MPGFNPLSPNSVSYYGSPPAAEAPGHTGSANQFPEEWEVRQDRAGATYYRLLNPYNRSHAIHNQWDPPQELEEGWTLAFNDTTQKFEYQKPGKLARRLDDRPERGSASD